MSRAVVFTGLLCVSCLGDGGAVVVDDSAVSSDEGALLVPGQVVTTAGDTPRSIPDNDAAGTTSTISVTQTGAATGVEVTFDVTHTYRGDLLVKLVCPDQTVVTLHDRTGGSADNLRLTTFVRACVGKAVAGSWKLVVADGVRGDVGRLNRFTLRLNGLPVEDKCMLVSGGVDDVYFADNPLMPWQTCYTTPIAEAAARIRSGAVPGSTVLYPETATISGTSIVVAHRYDYWPDHKVEFKPCVFTSADSCTYDCAVTFQDKDPFSSQAALVAREQACAAAHPQLAGRSADCQGGVVHPITNTWRQTVSRSELKLMQHLLAQPATTSRHELIVSAVGGLTLGGSLEACQDWSAPLAFTFARELQFAEVCDSSLEAVRRDFRIGESWCPWGLQISRVTCDGYPEIVNPRALTSAPLDLSVPEVTSFCTGASDLVVAATGLPKDIPDDNATGISSALVATASGAIAGLAVTVDITHPYRGDLVVRFRCPDGTPTMLHDRTGGGLDDLHQTYPVAACNGQLAGGTYKLEVFDRAGRDLGRLDGWKIQITR